MTAEFVSLKQLVESIAERVREPGEPLRECKNKIRKRLTYNQDKYGFVKDAKGYYKKASLTPYLRRIFLGKFDDWPLDSLGISLNATLDDVAGDVLAISTPNTIEDCHRLIVELTSQNEELRRANVALQAEVDSLKPDVERWRRYQNKQKKR